MSTAMTAAGESLVARLQAEGKGLVIDKMIFAHLPGQDHTQTIAPGVTVPAANVVHNYGIPPEYRAYVNPNQVVYSALLGSDVGDFVFNWQGLYCTEHNTLVAVATFPALEKRKYDVATGKTGNNLTRNFLLTFTGARELTGLTISADVWQLDFTVRLLGMDERERLSNFDLYGQGYFEGDGWLLRKSGSSYSFAPGLGYVGGIRALLPDVLPLPVAKVPQDVWLSVCLRPVGSDRVAEASAMLADVGTKVADAADETGLMHYRQIVARVEADGTVTDLRPKLLTGITPNNIEAVPISTRISVSTPLTGGGDLSTNRTIGINASAAPLNNYVILRDEAGRAQVSAPAVAADIARKAEVDAAASAKATVAFSAGGTRTATVAANTNYTVPSYVVGSGRLLVFLDGIKCAAGANAAQHQYKEVGTAGAASTVIQWHQAIDKTYDIEARVR